MPKLKLPRFFKGKAHRKQVFGKLKLIDCPHCGQSAYLIRNGRLYGNDPAQQGSARVQRGQRIRCSDRGRCGGCGRSFAIFHPQSLPHRSVGADYLYALLEAILEHSGCVHHAWLRGTRCFSLSTAYRLCRALKDNQFRLRHHFYRLAHPPQSSDHDPTLQLIAHLRAAFEECPIPAYHKHFQQSFLPGY